MEQNWKNLCRLCTQSRTNNMNSVVKDENNFSNHYQLSNIIKLFLDIAETLDDSFPNEICIACNLFLIELIEFKTICEKSQIFFAELLNSKKVTDATRINSLRLKHGLHNKDGKNNVTVNNEEISDATDLSFDNERLSTECIKVKTEIRDAPISEDMPETYYYDTENTEDEDDIPLNRLQENFVQTTKIEPSRKEHNDPLKIREDLFGKDLQAFLDNKHFQSDLKKCKICSRRFTKERYVRIHMRNTHKIIENTIYPCVECNRTFKQKETYEKHRQVHESPEFNNRVPCPDCGKKFSTKHMKYHHKYIHTNVTRKFVCEECGALFKALASLNAHKTSHRGELPWSCDVCDRRFKTKTNLFIHKDIHSETPYICNICGTTSTTMRGLRSHMIVHSDQKKYKCTICGNAFKRGTALKKHLIVHTGLKPYACNFCDKTFADGSNRRIHLKRVHPKEFSALNFQSLPPTQLPNVMQLKTVWGKNC